MTKLVVYMTKSIVERNFSKCARHYDKYANIQCLAADKLIEFTPDTGIKNILELGCGTGNYTVLLKEKFKTARIKAVDISKEMVNTAKLKPETRGVDFVAADAETMELSESYELITSNASFQWFDDPESSIKKYSGSLPEGGVILFSAFGPKTFLELNNVLEQALGKKAGIDSNNFLDKARLDKALKSNFSESSAVELTVKETYASLKDLLSKIKYTGTRGSGSGNILVWKKDMMSGLEEAYKKIFGKIEATYQIFFCRGIK